MDELFPYINFVKYTHIKINQLFTLQLALIRRR